MVAAMQQMTTSKVSPSLVPKDSGLLSATLSNVTLVKRQLSTITLTLQSWFHRASPGILNNIPMWFFTFQLFFGFPAILTRRVALPTHQGKAFQSRVSTWCLSIFVVKKLFYDR